MSISKQYNNHYRRLLLEKINTLSPTEHEEIFKVVKTNNVAYTQNQNGIFCNLSTVNDNTIEQISKFVKFCTENKKQLDEYDKKINECKINKNFDDLSFSSVETIVKPMALGEYMEEKQNTKDDWASMVASSKQSEKIMNFVDLLYNNITKVQKKKCNTKYNVAKKKYSKKIYNDKKFDFDTDHTLHEEEFLLKQSKS